MCNFLSSTGKARAIPYALTLASIGIFLAFDTLDDRRRLISAAGILIFVAILALLSKHPRKIDWRQVVDSFLEDKYNNATNYIMCSQPSIFSTKTTKCKKKPGRGFNHWFGKKPPALV